MEKLLELERLRCTAIAQSDIVALRELLSPDYVHVHATGMVDDLEDHIRGIVASPRAPQRGALSVRIYGDAAVIVGDQVAQIADETMTTVVTQVAMRQEGRWCFVSAQVTRRSGHP